MEPSTFSGSSKRPKAPANSPQATVHCLVDGCNADLSVCRDYHRRHKVCEIHSKTSRVTIGGREQRFCQQCSRFHSLVEFDEGKRSCRKRLDGHNRRRRKPQPDSHARNSALIFSTHQTPPGTRLLSFANPPMLPTSVPGHTWSAAIKLEPEIPLYTNHPFTDCSPRSVSQLQFVHGNDDQPNNNNNIAVSGSSSSDRALSLLSSAPPPEFHHVVLPPTQPLLHNIRYAGRFASPIIDEESKAFGNTGASSAASTTAHFPEMFQPPGGERPQSTLTGGPHQTLSFLWE